MDKAQYSVKPGDGYLNVAAFLIERSDLYRKEKDNATLRHYVAQGIEKSRGSRMLRSGETIELIDDVSFYLSLIELESSSLKKRLSKPVVNKIDYTPNSITFKLELKNDLGVQTMLNNSRMLALPNDAQSEYTLNGSGLQGPLDIYLNDRKYTAVPDISVFHGDTEGGMRVYFGSGSHGPADSFPRWNLKPESIDAQAPNDESIVVIECDKSKPDELTEGAHDIESLGENALKWLVAQLLGSNLPPLFLQMGEMAKKKEYRLFLKELFFNGKFYVKVHPKTGNIHIIFKGRPGLRSFLKGTRYTSNGSKVSVISAYADIASGSKAGFARGMKSTMKGNAIAFVVVGSVDIIEYICSNDPERQLSDLFVDLGVDFGKVVVAGVIGALAGACVVAIAAAAAVSAPVWLVVGAAVGVGLAVGFGLDFLDEEFGFTSGLKQFFRDAHFEQAISDSYTTFKNTWSALEVPAAKIFQLRGVILEAPSKLTLRSSPAAKPDLIGAIILDALQQKKALITRKSLLDTEAKFIELYEGALEKFEKWVFSTIAGKSIEQVGLGLGCMTCETVYDLVDNGYLRKEPGWPADRMDIAINWLTDELRVPILVGARLSRISQYWFDRSKGAVNISSRPDIIASLYYVGLASERGVAAEPEANADGKRIFDLIPSVRALLGMG